MRNRRIAFASSGITLPMLAVSRAINTCSLNFCFSDSKFLSNNSILFKRSSASFSNIFACSAVLRRSFNDTYDTIEELELEADSILEERFEEVDLQTNRQTALKSTILIVCSRLLCRL